MIIEMNQVTYTYIHKNIHFPVSFWNNIQLHINYTAQYNIHLKLNIFNYISLWPHKKTSFSIWYVIDQ